MPMIRCPDCERLASDQAEACPNCGRPLRQQPRTTVVVNNARPGGCLLLVVVLILLAAIASL